MEAESPKDMRKPEMREPGSEDQLRREVRTADAVVAHSTRWSIALRYDHFSMEAPRVVAEGVDGVAERIREAAQQYGVPIIEDPELAKALHDNVADGQAIPPDLYSAVARVMACAKQARLGRPARYIPLQQVGGRLRRPTAKRDRRGDALPRVAGERRSRG